jgi:hypothetical protein
LQSKRASADKLSWRGCKPPPKTANFPSLNHSTHFIKVVNSVFALSFFRYSLKGSSLFFGALEVSLNVSSTINHLQEPLLTSYQASSNQPRQNVWCSVSSHFMRISYHSRARLDRSICSFPMHSPLETSLLSHANCSARLAGINVGSAHVQPSGDFGLIGLAVMGQNLILNAADHGYTVVAFNRTVSKVDRFLENEAKGRRSPKP